MILEKKTITGRVVYNRKKHYFGVKDVVRILPNINNNFTAGDPEFGNGFDWKYVVDLATQNFRYFLEFEGIREDAANAIGERRLYGNYTSLNQFYNACVSLLNGIQSLAPFVSWVPYLGLVLDMFDGLWDIIKDNVEIAHWSYNSKGKYWYKDRIL